MLEQETPGAEATETALRAVALAAEQHDRAPAFPEESFEALREAGVLSATLTSAGGPDPSAEWSLLRRVAAADSSVGRILDGHFNAVERIAVAAEPEVREHWLARVADEGALLGVWGADPAPHEGDPAVLCETGDGPVLRGAKTFCSGAGGVGAALVMVRREEPGAPSLVLVEDDETVEVDRGWFRASGLRSSESHLVRFDSTPVQAVLGEPGELGRDPWFSRDAMRTAASWAGMIDAAASAALADLAARRSDEQLSQLAAGRIAAALGTVEAWLQRALEAIRSGSPELRRESVLMRAEIAAAARRLLDEAAAACGSTPFATGAPLDRARRDLELFLLQHRLDPLLRKAGAEILDG